jgi:hypothetical protein
MTDTTALATEFVLCVRNDGYPAALEPRKLYRTLPDTSAARHRQLRVIDESGEDYLYPSEYFIEVDLPSAAREAIQHAA